MTDLDPGEPPPDSFIPGRVSVVIPAYNCADTVGSAIESSVSQEFEDLEVVVVNDGSTDGTAEVLRSFGRRIRVISQANGGLAAARNAGQRAATGEYIAWMDGDDLMVPGRVQFQASVLALHPHLGLLSSDFSAFDDPEADFESSHIASYYGAFSRLGGAPQIYPVILPQLKWDGRDIPVRAGNVYDLLVWGNFIHPPTVMARRGLLDLAGASDETLRFSSDYDLIMRMARHADFGYLDGPLLRYRRHSGQMSNVGGGDKMMLETVRILEESRRRDTSLGARQEAVFRLREAESLIAAADAIGGVERRRALALLFRGIARQPLVRPSMMALGRTILPPSLIRTAKQLLRAAAGNSTIRSR